MKRKLFQALRRTKIYTPGGYNALPKRLNWEQIEARPRQEGRDVVKGTSKQVVVVKSPDPRVFEQAIFIVREDFLRSGRRDTDGGDILREAQAVADRYIRSTLPQAGLRRLPRVPPGAILAAAGAVLAGLVWLGLRLFGVI